MYAPVAESPSAASPGGGQGEGEAAFDAASFVTPEAPTLRALGAQMREAEKEAPAMSDPYSIFSTWPPRGAPRGHLQPRQLPVPQAVESL